MEGEGSRSRQVPRMVDPLLPFGSPLPRGKPQGSNAILPQHNQDRIKNTGSLQPFTKFYYDPVTTFAVVKRGDLEPIRVYIPQYLRYLSDEYLLALNEMKIKHLPKDWFDVE
ncbi:hypothetical protein L1987_20394 [Smallanthus sonchifolius]|uniref:Uncharacterized protein n=1 Tax=Smallanthus sonchifolius TaxID=185202 RepID=A0ACB9IRP7_9ASTR|nr:hypothetical protein L1987_20394 [Smallanthus sonchifolius]